MAAVRTRFAPSPTGSMHIGNLRTALYGYLIAKSQDGRFILRIEDTDQRRYVEGAVDIIYKTLKLAGLEHDEGPDKGGEYGPYVQSERIRIYMRHAEFLIENGSAYYCFCSKERLAELKLKNESEGRTNLYDRRCLSLSREQAGEAVKSGAEYVIRQKMPNAGKTAYHDVVYGDLEFDNHDLEDQILIKSDGFPTYNFANVVDDHLMAITHVVRGSEYLTSTPKYNLLYQSFGWKPPVYVHLPQIVKEGGRKLSKREGDMSFSELADMGYLPEAIINFIAFLGWSPPGNRELYTLDELARDFSIAGVSKSPSVFDENKLRFFNAEHIRLKTPDEFHALALPYIKSVIGDLDIDTAKIARLLFRRTEVFNEIPDMIGFFKEAPAFSDELYINKKMKTDQETSKQTLILSLPVLDGITDWDYDHIHDTLSAFASDNALKNGQVLWPLRVALSGLPVTPGGAVEILDILGKAESVRRISDAIGKL